MVVVVIVVARPVGLGPIQLGFDPNPTPTLGTLLDRYESSGGILAILDRRVVNPLGVARCVGVRIGHRTKGVRVVVVGEEST